ncbi:response regulator [Deferrisoma palaeochoriense]
MHILVVDDSSVVRKKAAEILEGAGHTCDLAENGLEGLKLALTNHYDAVLTDIVMPVLDGLKLVMRLRAGAKTRHLPILVLTSRSDADTVLQARELGVDGYLLKPLDPETLLDRLAKLPRRMPGETA